MTKAKKTLREPQADLLLEISWEVCNKIGGINTVLATKAAQMVKRYHKGYILVGPYFPKAAKHQFEEFSPKGWLKDAFDNLKAQGIFCHCGKWLIAGEPFVVLIDFQSLWPNINQYKWELWNDHKIDSMESGFEFDEPVVWGYAAGKLAEQIALRSSKKTVVHCHEWLAGVALLFAKKNYQKIGTVFTTHATTLGRSMAYDGIDFYSNIQNIDPCQEAYVHHVQAKHLLEKAAANTSDVFTTVSEITGIECRHFLGRAPDLFLPNGLDAGGYLSFEEAAIKHRLQRGRIREFLFYNFFGHYTFDLDDTLFYFLMARYEFRAKGIDSFINALSVANEKLKKQKSKKTIVAFFWVPAKTKGIHPDLTESRGNYFDVKEFIEENSGGLVERFTYSLFARKDLKSSDIFDEEPHRELELRLKKMRRAGLPLICTHELEYRDDQILKAFADAGLDNKEEDRVKVVFYPAYLTGTDKILNLTMQEAIQGCHLGVFPSYYEPWGYTPLEAAAEGVPAITSDSSGLGRFLKTMSRDEQNPGIFVLDNFGKDKKEIGKQLADILYDFAVMPRYQRVENKINARDLVNCFDWENLVDNYVAAHNLALKKSKSNYK